MSDGRTIMRSILVGGVFPVVAFVITALAMRTPDILIYYVNLFFPLAVWYVAVALGITATMSKANRAWPGMVVGAWSFLLFHGWTTLGRPAAERMDALLSAGGLAGSLGSIAMPWAFGMLLGWATITRRPVRHDGAL